jgi:ABC-type spermidine/putrescine transport system permease subunit II
VKRARLLGAHAWLVYAFLYAPIAILVAFSFNRARQTAVWEGWTLDWYRSLFANELIRDAVRNSLIVGCVSTAIATVVGTLAALALGRHEFRGKAFTRNLLYLPIIIPEIVVGAALVTFFGVLAFRLSIWTVVIAHVAFSISYVAIVVRARLSGFDRSLEEAALDLGARPWKVLLVITLPLIAPSLITGWLLAFTLSLDDLVIASFVSGPASTTLPMVIFSSVRLGVSPQINALATIFVAVVSSLVLVASWLTLRRSKGGGPGGLKNSPASPPRR